MFPRLGLALALAITTVVWTGTATAAAPVVVPASSTATPWRTNLVTNGGAEQTVGLVDGYTVVEIPGWSQRANFTAVAYGESDFPTVQESRRIGGGSQFFAGGDVSRAGTATQRIELRGRNAAIDRGRVRVRVSALLAGYASQRDSAQVIVRFLRADGSLISTVKTDAVSATNGIFIKKSASRIAPAGTRSLQVVLAARRGDGDYCDGYFDNIDVRLVPA
jgi:hypothetical protein